tara:strand:- start:5485 stop:6327 length:843 start_codon:yes stop_codon:yes gene_type:complete
MKHSKFKNTGLLFELLTRQITSDILNERDSKSSEILKKHFNKDSELFKEQRLFSAILDSKFKDRTRAEKMIETSIKAFSSNVNTKKLNREKYEIIKSIKENFDVSDFFKNRIPNYKLMASVHNVLTKNYSDPVSYDRSYQTIVENMMAPSKKTEESLISELKTENKDLRALAYKILVERFNKKYTGSLNNQQRGVLREYINCISNTSSLNDFISSKFKHVLSEIKKLYPQINNKVVKIKLKECVTLLNKTSVSQKNIDGNVLKLMRFYQLVSEVKGALKK